LVTPIVAHGRGAGRGRSGFDQSVLHEAKATGNWDMVPTFGRITDKGAWTAWFGHIIDGSNIMAGNRKGMAVA
jgi:hypothetical protein